MAARPRSVRVAGSLRSSQSLCFIGIGLRAQESRRLTKRCSRPARNRPNSMPASWARAAERSVVRRRGRLAEWRCDPHPEGCRECLMTSDVLLRDVIEDDLPIFFEQQQDPAANRMAAFTAKDPADRVAFTAKWAKILGDESITKRTILFGGQVAGNVSAFVAPWSGKLEVTYWIGREFWGKGIATRALAALLRAVKTRPLYARAAKDNIASLRVLEKCAFTIAG